MQVEVKVPQLSESISEATLLAWHKKAGEAVRRDENLIDIETDKVVLELPAPSDGVLAKIIKGDGGTVTSGEVIAVIDTSAAATTVGSATATDSSAKAEALASAVTPAKAGAQGMLPAAAGAKAASPAAAKMAMEQGIDTAKVAGTGRDGRVTKGDVLTAGSTAAVAPAPDKSARGQAPSGAQSLDPGLRRDDGKGAVVPLGARPEQRVAMSRLRVRIAERLVQSQSTAAILTTFNEVNMAPVMGLRGRYKDKFEKEHGVKLGFMSFFVKAAVAALRKFPVVNASIDAHDIVYHGYYDIGIAVGSERGLVVPILRDADRMSIAEIEAAIADFGKRAKDGKITLEELSGGTFSISNGGVFGSMLSTPIINPPQSAILGVHATKERPVAENGQIVIRPMNFLALSYDHRIIDGREAVLSLVAIKEALEDPARLLLDI